jgi:hypothetical protein
MAKKSQIQKFRVKARELQTDSEANFTASLRRESEVTAKFSAAPYTLDYLSAPACFSFRGLTHRLPF